MVIRNGGRRHSESRAGIQRHPPRQAPHRLGRQGTSGTAPRRRSLATVQAKGLFHRCRRSHTDHLSIACDLYGSEDAPVVLLLHGWPDDATTWDRVAPRLAQAGLRVVVPTLRGFGATRFRHDHTRTGDSAILALDAIALMDALGIDRFMVAGHDWGSNIAEALAVGWPERVCARWRCLPRRRAWGHADPVFRPGAAAMVSLVHGNPARRAGGARRPARLCPYPLGQLVAAGWFDEATFNRVAKSFDNPTGRP